MGEKIVPVFGKKRNKVSCIKKETKKFVAPTKINNDVKKGNEANLTETQNNELAGFNQSVKNLSMNEITNLPLNIVDAISDNAADLNFSIHKPTDGYIMSADAECNNNIPITHTDLPNNDYQSPNNLTQNTSKIKTKKHSAFEGFILNSINLLNDDEITQNLSQDSAISERSVSISRNDSITSVASLSKTYKNLDVKSFTEPPAKSDEILCPKKKENSTKACHEIPTDDCFLKLFEGRLERISSKDRKVMTTELGDIGFNVFYTDYIKDVGNRQDCNAGADDAETILLILKMYPKENATVKLDKK